MSHYHCEVIIPPVFKGREEEAIRAIMKPFQEGFEKEDWHLGRSFWEHWTIGGRFSGRKLLSTMPQVALGDFYKWLTDQGVTIFGLTFGKPYLSPPEQAPMVDAEWNRRFPPKDGKPIPCPLFYHSSQMANSQLAPMDIATLGECRDVECQRLIIGSESVKDFAQARYMIEDRFWNGVSFQKTWWDGKIRSAMDSLIKAFGGYAEDFKARCLPNDDWLVVTVDCHS